MPNRILACVLAILCASPFTAPFQTFVPIQLSVPTHSAVLQAIPDYSWPSDPAALTVPPLDAHVVASKWERPLVATHSSVARLIEAPLSFLRADDGQAHPREFQPPRIIPLRI